MRIVDDRFSVMMSFVSRSSTYGTLQTGLLIPFKTPSCIPPNVSGSLRTNLEVMVVDGIAVAAEDCSFGTPIGFASIASTKLASLPTTTYQSSSTAATRPKLWPFMV